MTTILSITALLLAGIVLLLKIRSLFTATVRSLAYIRKYFYVVNDARFIAAFSRLRGYILVLRNLKAGVAISYFVSLGSVFYSFFHHSRFLVPGIFTSYTLLGVIALFNLTDQLLYKHLTTMLDNVFTGRASKYAPSI